MRKCDQCGLLTVRRRFCCNKCKDTYHNIHNPRGKYAFMAKDEEKSLTRMKED
jgi:hypothetical protein